MRGGASDSARMDPARSGRQEQASGFIFVFEPHVGLLPMRGTCRIIGVVYGADIRSRSRWWYLGVEKFGGGEGSGMVLTLQWKPAKADIDARLVFESTYT